MFNSISILIDIIALRKIQKKNPLKDKKLLFLIGEISKTPYLFDSDGNMRRLNIIKEEKSGDDALIKELIRESILHICRMMAL